MNLEISVRGGRGNCSKMLQNHVIIILHKEWGGGGGGRFRADTHTTHLSLSLSVAARCNQRIPPPEPPPTTLRPRGRTRGYSAKGGKRGGGGGRRRRLGKRAQIPGNDSTTLSTNPNPSSPETPQIRPSSMKLKPSSLSVVVVVVVVQFVTHFDLPRQEI